MQLSKNFIVTGQSSVIETSFFYPVRLDDGYEMALSSFSCGSICNVNSRRNLVHIACRLGDLGPLDGLGSYLTEESLNISIVQVELSHGYYHTVTDLFKEICDSVNAFLKIHHHPHEAEWEYFPKTNTTKLILPNEVKFTHNPRDSDAVLCLLELEEGTYNKLEARDNELYPIPDYAFLYSSIVAESYINANSTRLFAVIPLSQNTFSYHFEPINPKYYPIAIEEFNTITFELRDSSGHLIEFCSSLYETSKYASKLGTKLPIVLSISLANGDLHTIP